MKIIGLSGKRGTGKTTLADILHKHFEWTSVSFAAKMKYIVRSAFHLSSSHTDGELKETPLKEYGGATPRDIMIATGRFFRQFDDLFWVKQALEFIPFGVNVDPVVISDVRYKNEADYIKKLGGKVIRLERGGGLNIYKGVITDPSETELDTYDFDRVIKAEDNVSPMDLMRVAAELNHEARTGEVLIG